jgi:hypothetical protein
LKQGLIRRQPKDVLLVPVLAVAEARFRLEELQKFVSEYLVQGPPDTGDFGVIPGAGTRKVLYKSGAEKLSEIYGMADRYTILSKIENFNDGLFAYTIQCELYRKTDEMFVGTGLGSCSTFESRYRWRQGERVCPTCGKAAIIRGKAEYGGGWLCFKKKDGCGAKFAETDQKIVSQSVGRVENPDIIDQANTVLKMAKKRAKVDAVIAVTRSSGLFTQDVEADDHEDPQPQAGQQAEVRPIARPAVQAPPKVEAPAPAPAPAGTEETHAERIARTKAEAAARAAKAAPAPAPAAPPVTASGNESSAQVFITGINARNGPVVMKDGVSKPSWGPLYVIAFSQKVKATDGAFVVDATTFDEKIAKLAEDARDAHEGDPTSGAVLPQVTPGKKGSYNLVAL